MDMSSEERTGEGPEAQRAAAVAELFRQFPREATEERLDAVKLLMRRIPAPWCALVVENLLLAWGGKRDAPKPGDIWDTWLALRARLHEEASGDTVARASAASDVASSPDAVAAYVLRVRALFADGRYVPPRGALGRLLAAMRAVHEDGRTWDTPILRSLLVRLEEALLAHERRARDTGRDAEVDIGWWEDFARAQGWRDGRNVIEDPAPLSRAEVARNPGARRGRGGRRV